MGGFGKGRGSSAGRGQRLQPMDYQQCMGYVDYVEGMLARGCSNILDYNGYSVEMATFGYIAVDDDHGQDNEYEYTASRIECYSIGDDDLDEYEEDCVGHQKYFDDEYTHKGEDGGYACGESGHRVGCGKGGWYAGEKHLGGEDFGITGAGTLDVPLPTIEDGSFKVKAHGLDKQGSGERNVRIVDTDGGTFEVPQPTIEDGIFAVKAYGFDKKDSGERNVRIVGTGIGAFDFPLPTIEVGIFVEKAHGLDKKGSGERSVRTVDRGGSTFDVPLPTIEDGILEAQSYGLIKSVPNGLAAISSVIGVGKGSDDFDDREAEFFIQEFKGKGRGKDLPRRYDGTAAMKDPEVKTKQANACCNMECLAYLSGFDLGCSAEEATRAPIQCSGRHVQCSGMCRAA